MDFFNKLSKKASETYKGVSEKTNKLTREAKLKMKMNDSKSKISDLYEEIGKKVYEKHTLKEEINIETYLEEEITRIDVLSAEIENCLNEIRLLNDKKQCIKCFAEIEKDAKFCLHCGAEQTVEEVKEVEIVENIEISNETVNEEVENNETVEANNSEETESNE
ncbi:MAG: zinc ribbon domain-containing protein [Clostridia bacterium]|nr:zinc ribbon domain-containing protein [Clostridia bacterium]